MARTKLVVTRALLLLLVASVCALAQDDPADVPEPEVVHFPYTLEVGDSVALKFSRSREISGTDSRQAPTHLENTVRFAVVEENEPGHVLAWNAEWEEVANVLKMLGEEGETNWVREALDTMTEHVLLIQTDEYGTPVGLVNMDETVALFERVVARMIESLPLEAEERAALKSMVGHALSPTVLVSRILQDASLYFMFSGGSFELGEEYIADEQLPNPYGGAPIPSQIHFVVRSVDRVAGVAHVDYWQETDAKVVRSVLREFFAQLPDGEEMLSAMDETDMGITSEAVYVMDLTSGLPQRLHFSRRVEMGQGRRVDDIVIETASLSSR